MQNLKAMGIKTIIDLRAFHSDHDELGNTGLECVSIPMHTWHGENEDAVKFLQIVMDPARQPVLVHCQHGADRTGALMALYRMTVQGWPRDDAIREMTEGGYNFHPIWENLVDWMEKVDVDKLRRAAGIKRDAASSQAPVSAAKEMAK